MGTEVRASKWMQDEKAFIIHKPWNHDEDKEEGENKEEKCLSMGDKAYHDGFDKNKDR